MDAPTEAVERRSMIAHDKRIYYRPQLEPFCDPEWEEAERSEEKPQYSTREEGEDALKTVDMFTLEEIEEIARYLHLYFVSHKEGD